MFSPYSKGCEYAIRALVQMALVENGKFRAVDICRKAEIPEAYSRKTFQALVQTKFLKAVPGPGGGYSLNGDPAKITVLDVIYAVDGKGHFAECVLGLPHCGDHRPCALHDLWLRAKGSLLEALAKQTLKDLAHSSVPQSRLNRKNRVS